MFDSLLNLCAVFIFFAGPTWAGELTGLLPVYLAVTAAQLIVILLAAFQPAHSTSGAGRAARRFWRVALTLIAIAALNVALNLIWPFRF